MSIPPTPANYSPTTTFSNIDPLSNSTELSLIYASSSPLMQASFATLKNLPYLIAAKEFKINDICHAVSSRGNYLEVAMISVASLIHNVVLALFYSSVVVLTFGQSENFNFDCRKHWIHAFHSLLEIGIGCLGTIRPKFGKDLDTSIIKRLFNSVVTGYQQDLKLLKWGGGETFKMFFNKNKSAILSPILSNHLSMFKKIGPSFFFNLSQKVNAAQNMSDIKELIEMIWEELVGKSNEIQNSDISKGDWSILYEFFNELEDEAWKKLPDSTKSLYVLIHSASLIQLSSATLKNLPYMAVADHFNVNDMSHMFSSRFNYMEAALIGFACVIYNIAMVIFDAGLVILTMGQSERLNFNLKMHWLHLTHSVLSVGIGLSGTLVPILGVGLNALLVDYYQRSMFANYERDLTFYEEQLVNGIIRIYNNENYHETLVKFAQNLYNSYQKDDEFQPVIKYIDEKVCKAKKMRDFYLLLEEIEQKFPWIHLSEEEIKAKISSRHSR